MWNQKRIAAAAVTIALLASPWARAELKEGTVAPDIDAKGWINTDRPVSLAELRGMIVVLFFWESFSANGEATMPLMTLVDNNENTGRQAGVFVMGVTEADRKRTEEPIKKAKIFFPIAVESKARQEYEITSFPYVVILDVEGKVAWSGWSNDGGDQMLDKLIEIYRKAPPTRTHPTEAALASKYIEEARQCIREGKVRDAYRVAVKSNEHALTGDPLKARCQEYVDLLESLGQDLLASGERELVMSHFDKAVEYFLRCAKDYRGLESARRARMKLQAIGKERSEVKAILDAQSREADAARQLLRARDLIEQQSFADAYLECEAIVTTAPGTDSAAGAATLIQRMEKHPAIAKLVRDQKAAKECEPLLAQARSDIRQKRYAQARPKLEQIIRKHPETTYADQARKLIIDMP